MFPVAGNMFGFQRCILGQHAIVKLIFICEAALESLQPAGEQKLHVCTKVNWAHF